MAKPGDTFEVDVGPFVVDVCRGDLLIEIQTGSFAAMGRKMDALLDEYRILLVHPIAVETYLYKPPAKPRKSPKKATVYNIFDELVSFPTLLDNPNLTIEILLVSINKHQIADPTLRRNRGGWRTVDKELREIKDHLTLSDTCDLLSLLPNDLPTEFNTHDLSVALKVERRIAQRMTYCLRALGALEILERNKSGIVYRRN